MQDFELVINCQTTQPLRVGLVGTGYVAKRRTEAFQASEYADLVAVSGHSLENTKAFCETYNLKRADSWQDLINDESLDLICISNLNQDHSLITRRALEVNKHVMVEYPLAFNPSEARELIKIAEAHNKLLHVEHIELLGGLHQAIVKHLLEIGNPFFARYTTITPVIKAPRRWNYHYHQYGFPLVAALSRIHRFTDLFGTVATVSCQARFWDAPESGYFTSCLCQAHLGFNSGLIAEITYGKGETFASGHRTFEIYGDEGTLMFEGEKGTLIRGDETRSIEVGSRRGLLAKDTNMVLANLLEDKPLYVNNSASCYALEVADAAFQSYRTGTTIKL